MSREHELSSPLSSFEAQLSKKEEMMRGQNSLMKVKSMDKR